MWFMTLLMKTDSGDGNKPPRTPLAKPITETRRRREKAAAASAGGRGEGINAGGTEEPCRDTPLATGSCWCPGPRPSLTMMATPENMTAETSCQTLREKEDGGHGVSTGAMPSLRRRKAFLAARSVVSLHPLPSRNRGQPRGSPHPGSSILAGETEPKILLTQAEGGSDPAERMVSPWDATTQSHARPGASPAPREPLWFPVPAVGQELEGLRMI